MLSCSITLHSKNETWKNVTPFITPPRIHKSPSRSREIHSRKEDILTTPTPPLASLQKYQHRPMVENITIIMYNARLLWIWRKGPSATSTIAQESLYIPLVAPITSSGEDWYKHSILCQTRGRRAQTHFRQQVREQTRCTELLPSGSLTTGAPTKTFAFPTFTSPSQTKPFHSLANILKQILLELSTRLSKHMNGALYLRKKSWTKRY